MSNTTLQSRLDAAMQARHLAMAARLKGQIEITRQLMINRQLNPDSETGQALGKASQFRPLLPHKERLHTRLPIPFCEESCPVHLRVEHFENPDLLPWRVERTRWQQRLLTADAQEYREYVACCVEMEMKLSIYQYWNGARPRILSNAIYLYRALVAEVQLYRHQLTHGLSLGCSHLHVIDKSWWLSRLVKWLLRIPSNPYPWVDELCARQVVESADSVSAGSGQVSG